MSNSVPVFVWRSELKPKLPQTIGGKCIYCSMPLSDSDPWIEANKREFEAAQIERYGKPLDEMSESDWQPFKERARALNGRKDADPDYDEAEDIDEEKSRFDLYMHPFHGRCPRCGWWLRGFGHGHSTGVTRAEAAIIRKFDIESDDILIREVSSHLAKHFSDIYKISPRRFEQVVAEIYGVMGWRVELTQATRDGGIDLVCLSNGDSLCIVECKRYATERKVSIEKVDRLLGVAFRVNAQSAHLITTSSFTRPAKEAAKFESKDINMDLIDAHDLLRLLRTYTDDKLTVNDLSAIFG
jgi:hypothetical protein